MTYVRIATVSALIAGWLAILMAFNAYMGNDGLGAGALMLASALAFGSVMWTLASLSR